MALSLLLFLGSEVPSQLPEVPAAWWSLCRSGEVHPCFTSFLYSGRVPGPGEFETFLLAPSSSRVFKLGISSTLPRLVQVGSHLLPQEAKFCL